MPIAAVLALIAAAAAAAPNPGRNVPIAPPLPQEEPAEAALENSRQFDFVSAINGESYRVQIALPYRPAPPGGFPVVYVLDGNLLFGTMASATRTRANAGELEQAVIVGIESGPGPHSADRTLDFTATDLTSYEKTVDKENDPSQATGGFDLFHEVIETEIKPRVAQLTTINKRRQAIFGWSLGGLFVVREMLRHPEAYSDYMAISPSLFWGDKEAFHQIPQFKHHVVAQGLKPRFALAVGGLEQDASIKPLPDMSQSDWTAENTYARMVGNAAYLHAALLPFFQGRKDGILFQVLRDDTHASGSWTAINTMLNFSFGIGRFKRNG